MDDLKKTVLAFGEILWDCFPKQGASPAQRILGGAPFNFIYRVNSIGDIGLMVSRLGRDDLGNGAFDEVKRLGLDTTYIQRDDTHPTGKVRISPDDSTTLAYHIFKTIGGRRVAYDLIELTPELQEIGQKIDCFCFGTLAQRYNQSRNTLTAFLDEFVSNTTLKFVDINLRKNCYTLNTVKYSVDKANALKLSGDEMSCVADILSIGYNSIAGFCKEIIKRYDLDYCVATLAEKGAFAMARGGEKVYVPGYKVEHGDATGAGDAFSAGFVYKVLRKSSLTEACEYGNVFGALVASKVGATCCVTQSEINHFSSMTKQRIVHNEFK